MHSGFEIPGIHHHSQPPENACAPVMLSMNQTHILDQIHSLPTTQQPYPQQQHHFLPPQHHHFLGGISASTPFFPAVNFKLGLNEICTAEPAQQQQQHHHSLGILHCWQNQQDSAIKQQQQQPFWEPLPAEASNENSEIVDRQEQPLTTPSCLDPKNRVHFGELEAIYKHASANLPSSEATTIVEEEDDDEEEDEEEENKKRKRKRKKQGSGYSYSKMISPMAEFFGNLMKQMMDHQENLHKKFTEMIERLDEERRAREESWRNQELAHFEKEAKARARERRLAQNREAIIVSYLEKITGQSANFSLFQQTEFTSTSGRQGEGEGEGEVGADHGNGLTSSKSKPMF